MTDHHTVAERLRQALPLMSRHGISVTPVNYAVWYEYVSGENDDLRIAIDDLLQYLLESLDLPADRADHRRSRRGTRSTGRSRGSCGDDLDRPWRLPSKH